MASGGGMNDPRSHAHVRAGRDCPCCRRRLVVVVFRLAAVDCCGIHAAAGGGIDRGDGDGGRDHRRDLRRENGADRPRCPLCNRF